jgi:hypothetical protein
MEGSIKEIVCHFKHDTVLSTFSENGPGEDRPSFGGAGNSGNSLNAWS